MDISLDNRLSSAVLKLDNELSPFHKSVSCWSLVAFFAIDIALAIKNHTRETLAGNQLQVGLAMLAGLCGVLFLWRYRAMQAQLLQTTTQPDTHMNARKMSFCVSSLTGTVLFVVALYLMS